MNLIWPERIRVPNGSVMHSTIQPRPASREARERNYLTLETFIVLLP